MKDKPDLFARDSYGRTSLFHAAETGNIEEVRQIIFSLAGTGVACQRLSLLRIKDKSGITAAEAAENAGQKEIARLLHSELGRMEYYE